MAKIAAPLSVLTGYNKSFVWTAECQHTFTDRKAALASVSALTLSNRTKHYFLITDGSNGTVGGIILRPSDDHEDKYSTNAFVSHKLTDVETRWPTHEVELFAIVYAFKKLKFYIAGQIH